MEEYLKKKSKLSTEFISDFFNLTQKNYEQNDFTIDFEKIVKWLSLSKENLKETITAKFEENYDYKKNSENFTMTPNCFKDLCTILQTSKSKEIRKNYIEIENLIFKYNSRIKKNKYSKEKIIYVLAPMNYEKKMIVSNDQYPNSGYLKYEPNIIDEYGIYDLIFYVLFIVFGFILFIIKYIY